MDRTSSGRVEMLPAERHALILELLRERNAASIQLLADRLGASISTVRRDLDVLTEQGYLERTHGGAVSRRAPAARFEPASSIATATARAQKEAIGRLAAERVSAGQSVIFDSSSTVAAAALELARRGTAFTAVTNGLQCAAVLHDAPAIHTLVVGGAVRPGTRTLVGEIGRSFLSQIRADIALVGVHAISGAVLSETSVEVAAMKRLMIEASSRVIVLADSSKFGAPSFCEICRAGRIDELISDDGATEEQLSELRGAGVECTLASVAAEPAVEKR